jgi:hypothetical protein
MYNAFTTYLKRNCIAELLGRNGREVAVGILVGETVAWFAYHGYFSVDIQGRGNGGCLAPSSTSAVRRHTEGRRDGGLQRKQQQQQ